MATLSVSPWLRPWETRITFAHETTPQELDAIAERSPAPIHTTGAPSCSTTHASYIANVGKVIESCRQRGGKTVYSRLTASEIKAGFSPGMIYADMCAEFPDTCRFIFHTPSTGLWMGATPELLLDYHQPTARCRVMSLAGTRPQGLDVAWDEKNRHENQFVADFITESFRQFGIEACAGPLFTLPYGDKIEHLCREITAIWPENMPISRLIDQLNPTPALCGTPKAEAIADIAAHESHPRGCYGGIIALEAPEGLQIFVMLRCCHIAGNRLTAITGGGITPDSDPETEWAESNAKASFFQKYLEMS